MKNPLLFVPIMLACLFAGCQSTPDTATAEKMVREVNAQFQQQPYQTMEQNTPADYVFINGEGVFATKEQMLQAVKDVKISKLPKQTSPATPRTRCAVWKK